MPFASLQPADTQAGDTIAAVSSPPGRSQRGLIRISGPSAFPILESLLAGPAPDQFPPRVLSPARLASPPIAVLVARFPRPAGYTGEDAVELQLPGNPALLQRMLRQATRAGARLAEPGEFTFRAFTAGKLDLTQAEGVAATIAATSDGQLKAAELLRQGRLGGLAHELVNQLSDTLALVEAGIDFADEEDVVPISPEELLARLQTMRSRLEELYRGSRAWGEIETLPRVVLVGPPSSGKSTLFNALLGYTRAVVSPAAGTTRDVLSEPIKLPGPTGRPIELMLVDLAGLDTPRGQLDRQIQQTAAEAIERADLLLLTHPAEAPYPDTPLPFTLPDDTPRLRVLTKADLASDATQTLDVELGVSATEPRNLELLRRTIAERIGHRAASPGSDMLALQPRHEQAIQIAIQQFDVAIDHLQPQRHQRHIDRVELIADTLRGTLDALGALGGEMTPDDVLGRVFATFCIGK